ncbi:MAG: hypothetical protein WDM88_11050 [Galbitalea sp.]
MLILNRAGWAAHVLGSLFVGVFVYFAGTAATLLFHLSQIPSNEGGLAYRSALFSIGAIVAALVARESRCGWSRDRGARPQGPGAQCGGGAPLRPGDRDETRGI